MKEFLTFNSTGTTVPTEVTDTVVDILGIAGSNLPSYKSKDCRERNCYQWSALSTQGSENTDETGLPLPQQ